MNFRGVREEKKRPFPTRYRLTSLFRVLEQTLKRDVIHFSVICHTVCRYWRELLNQRHQIPNSKFKSMVFYPALNLGDLILQILATEMTEMT